MDSEKCLTIIAEEVGVPRYELQEDTIFADLGIDDILARAITDRIAQDTPHSLPCSVFDACPDVQSLSEHLGSTRIGQTTQTDTVKIAASKRKRKQKIAAKGPPLALLSQGDPSQARKTLFLLPDGSGSGMAYARLPQLDPNICVYALNSPFLSMGAFSTTIEDIGTTFATAIRKVQPHGPYYLGGWSAGGFFATEVARYMIRSGEAVDCVVLIDSPCRLSYSSLPFEVVEYLASRGLMGNWGIKKTPQWLLDHFEGVLAAVAKYTPVPINGHVPSVYMIQATDGIFGSLGELSRTGLNQSPTAQYLLGPRPKKFNPSGWERLYPKAQLWWAQTSGNHFTLVHPPNVSLALPLSFSSSCSTPLLEFTSELLCHTLQF